VDQETLSRQHKSILHWLLGRRANAGEGPIEGIETKSWGCAEEALRVGGIVGDLQ
jgi:hypothetical protein